MLIISFNVVFANDINNTENIVYYSSDETFSMNITQNNELKLSQNSSFIENIEFESTTTEIDKVSPNITYITPSSVFEDNLTVEILCDDDNATIYYTLDGSSPLNSSSRLVYSEPFVLNHSAMVRVTAIDNYGNYAQENYTWTEICFIGDFNKYETRFYCLTTTYLKKTDVDSGAIWSRYNFNNGISNYGGSLTNITKWINYNIVSSGSVVIDKEGHIYVSGGDGYLYCLNNQGLVIWRYGTASKIICSPTIGYDGNIYFSNWMNSSLYCISPNGELLWKYELGDYNTGSSPIFSSDGTLYVVSGNDTNSTLFAFKDFELKWKCNLPVTSGSTPVISGDGVIYLLSNQHELIAVNWDGTIKYISRLVMNINPVDDDLNEMDVSVTVRDDGCIYVINQPHFYAAVTHNRMTWSSIRAYYPNGDLKWYYHTFLGKLPNAQDSFRFSGAPTLYNNILYCVGMDNLVAFNATNGNLLFDVKINEAGYSKSSPLISANEIIYVSHGDMVFAFKLNGGPIWNYTMSGKYGGPISFSSPVLSDDGTLIVTTDQGIWAFNDISADFSYEHVNNTERTIKFTDMSTEGNNKYYWSFGDGFYSTEQNPSHAYKEAGKYRVELIVTHNGINLARNTTIIVETWDITPPSVVTPTINGEKTKGGVFGESQTVELSASDDYAVANIYYTVDGSNPVVSNTRRVYVEPIDIETYTILNAVAVDTSNNWGKVSTFTFNITDSINVNDKINSTLIQEIQDLLDNAEEGSKFVFDYDVLYGANFTINKPLNIITNNNTKLIGNGVQPVFTIGENAKGSSINGFTIENDGYDAVLIKSTDNITVKDSVVSAADAVGINIINSSNTVVKDTHVDDSTNGIIVDSSVNTELVRVDVRNSYDNGVWILNSQKTTLKDSLLENNGEDPYFSSAHQVLLDGSKDTNLLNNRINYGVFGIRLKNTNDGVTIDNNTVYEGVGDAILLEGKFSNVDITHNDLDGSFMGINFNGYSQNVHVAHNVIHNMHSHEGNPVAGIEYDLFYGFKHSTDLYGCYYNSILVFELAKNFHEGNVTIVDNICINTQHRAWDARKSGDIKVDVSCSGYGYNLWDGSDAYDGKNTGTVFYTPGRVDLVLDRVGDSSYRLRLINRLDNHYLSEIPAFNVKFTAGSYSQTVKFEGSEAVATFDVAAAITSVTATISSYISKSVSFDIPITEGYSSSNKESDPGYEAGEAINNPNPKVPSIEEYSRSHGNNGNGQGTGTGNGQGSGNGHGSSGHGGSDINGREGDVEGNSNNLVRTNGGTSLSVGVEAAAEGSSDSVEGGSESGETQDSAKAYEVTKEININNNNWQFVLAVILFAMIVIFGYGYRRGKDDGDEM